ncbi:MAG TPA: MbnP family protein [Agriterribacter sp.]|nr:MbnP family protein [Agriterribacter sp.]
MKTCIIYITVFCSFLFWSCQKELKDQQVSHATYPLHIIFRPVIKDQPLVPGQNHTNAFGEDYNISAFRFYVSKLGLKSNSATVPLPTETKYRLADAGLTNTLSFSLSTDQNTFSSLSFQLGVDSIDNVSGAQSGDLDPAKGMFWTWNSGYIMAKLEGASSYSSVPDGNFTYHIGGFSGATNAIRSISMQTPGGAPVTLNENKATTILIIADIDKWFNAVHPLKIADHAFVHSPGELAKLYADNYATMFSITEITEE